jgi:hypothetical protein
MVRELAAIRDSTDSFEYFSLTRGREIRGKLATTDLPVRERAMALYQLGRIECQMGDVRASIDRLTAALRFVKEFPEAARPAADRLLRFMLGVAYLRLAETENCCARPTAGGCLFPIRGDGVHDRREGSEHALECFRTIVETTPQTERAYHAARWLCCVSAMTLGKYPDAVPPEHRLPPSALRSDEPFPRFRDIAPALGLDTFGLAGGAAADDFDGDGDLDLIVSCWHPAGQIRYWRNEGGAFVDATDEAGLRGLLGGLNLLQADYDNDGDLDLLVLRGAWLGANGRHPNSLLRNDGAGHFRDVTFAAGLGEVHYPTQTAGWADYDGDGDLDLYVGNESSETIRAPSQLFRNEGDGTFRDVAAAAGVTNDLYAKGVTWGDYDGDDRPDLYVSNYFGRNRLYRNNGDGTFEDVAPRLHVATPVSSFPTWFWDYDNDGALDLFVGSFSGGVAELSAAYAGTPVGVERASLYRGDGRGGLHDVAREMGLDRPMLPMGSNFGDLDGDGWLDFYLGTGHPEFEVIVPNVMYRNRAGRGFADVTIAGGFGHLQKGHGIVFADFDQDGDEDVFEQMGGAYPVDPFRDVLYENPGFGTRWIEVRLVGGRSNGFGVGARIRVDFVEGGKTRTVYRHVNSGGSFGANPLRQHIGLGHAERIVAVEVHWPTTGSTQRHDAPPLDRLLMITEGEHSLESRRLTPFRFHAKGPDSGH